MLYIVTFAKINPLGNAEPDIQRDMIVHHHDVPFEHDDVDAFADTQCALDEWVHSIQEAGTAVFISYENAKVTMLGADEEFHPRGLDE